APEVLAAMATERRLIPACLGGYRWRKRGGRAYGWCRSASARCGVAAAEDRRGDARAVDEPGLSFAGLLRQLRAEARLTQEELAEAAGLSTRSVSDLERGTRRTAPKKTRQ